MESIKQLPSNGLTVVDFFCGAGIGAIGIEAAGFDTVYAFDNNKYAVKTYNHNFNKNKVARVLDANKMTVNDIPHADLYVGGFPCQPFSIVGKKLGKDDPDKGNLGMLFAKFIVVKKPKSFMIENVSGITNRRNIDFLQELVEELSKEYEVSWDKYNLVDYGVPQERVRLFIVGIRKDIKGKFHFPAPSSKKFSVNDAIGDLPKKPDNINNHYDHPSYKLRKDEIPFAHKVPIGGNWRSLAIEDQKLFMKGAFAASGGRTGFLRKINTDEPAKTILSSPMGKATAQILDWGINDQRRYTVRESLRLQTVPDWFNFPEDIPISKQYERCSGIPSLVAYKIAVNIAKAIKED